MIHYVYKITNLANNNFYIGSRSHPNPKEDTYMGSSKVLNNLYKLNGMESFIKEIIQEFNTRDEANMFENILVESFLKECPDILYNIRIPGYNIESNINIYNKRNDLWGDYYEIIRGEYLDGVKIPKIATKYGCDIGTIHSIVEDLKLGNKWGNIWRHKDEAISDYVSGLSRKFLSKKYKCDLGTVKTFLIENNIPIRTIKEQFILNKKNCIPQGKQLEIDLELFKKLYLEDDLPMNQISKIMGLYVGTLKKHAIKHGIPIKSYSWRSKLKRHKAWSMLNDIEKDKDVLTKSQLKEKYHIKDNKTLNSILNEIKKNKT
jgi:hypothetical protein